MPPMPGEPLLLGAGALAGTGYFRLWFAAALAHERMCEAVMALR